MDHLKECTKCHEHLPRAAFYVRKRRRSLYEYKQCRACLIERASNLESRLKKLEYIVAYFKAHQCVDCGERDHVVLQFDHLDRTTKAGSPQVLLYGRGGYDAFHAEVAKCEVVCANCHMRRTAKQLKWHARVRAPKDVAVGGGSIVGEGMEGATVSTIEGHTNATSVGTTMVCLPLE